MTLKFDWIAIALASLVCLLFFYIKIYLLKKYFSPSLAFSTLKNIEKKQSFRATYYFIPKYLYYTSFFLFLVAFIDPHLNSHKKSTNDPSHSSKIIPVEGIAIYLLLDQSSSMSQAVFATEQGQQVKTTKIALSKQVTKEFIEKRPNDLMGLIYFARTPQVIAPLTLDHRLLIQDLDQLKVVKGQENDGTSLGYAIYKAAHLIAATRHYAVENSAVNSVQYQINSAVIIAVTDGMQDPNYLDKGNRLRTIELEEVAQFAKEQNIKLYIINIDSAFATEQYAPHRRQMQKITKLTGGDFYLANESKDLMQIYATIDRLEKSQIMPNVDEEEIVLRHLSFYPYLIGIGMICFFLASILETFYFKVFP